MVLILQTLRPKLPYNLRYSQVTTESVLLAWDGDKGDVYINNSLNESDIYSPMQVSGLAENTEYVAQIKNDGGESNKINFRTEAIVKTAKVDEGVVDHDVVG